MEPRDLNGAWGLQLDYRKTVTNSDGTFELRNMPVGLTDICVWDAKRGIVRVVQVLVPEHPPHDIGDIPAFTYANISGKVHSSMALPADLVVAVFDGNDRFCGEMSIDGSGSFRTEALLGGRFQLELRRRGERGLSLARIPVDLEEEELKHVDLYYGPAQLQGSIVPMPSREGGALWEVQLSRSDNGQRAARREIDPYGRFEIQGLLPGKYQVEARAYAGPKRAVATAQVELKEGRNEVIIRRAGTQADLRVVDSKGEPVKGATMRARRIGSPPVLLGDTDEKGEFRVEDLEPGSFAFSLRAPGFEEVFRSTLALKPNSEETQVIRLPRESLLTVRTLDLRDRPVSAAQVRVSRLDGMAPRTLLESTDGLGSVQFQKLGAGEHTIFVKPSGRGFPVKLVRNLAAESSHLETLKIRNTGTLEVRVLNKEGVAISDVAVDATVQGVEGSLTDWTADGWVEVESGSAVTDSQGRLIIRRFPEGQVTVSAPGAVPALATVKPGEAATATLLMP
ncbi:MAG: carboxypeptidase regulatory-like domain-containing protein [Planctomycetes bacterium]|nr:carboxypeptidase regulatory-like domain-containing protein [Planctomycetota bacterium]